MSLERFSRPLCESPAHVAGKRKTRSRAVEMIAPTERLERHIAFYPSTGNFGRGEYARVPKGSHLNREAGCIRAANVTIWTFPT